MAVSISEAGVQVGSAKAAEELGRPSRGPRKRINGYSYSATASAPQSPGQQRAHEQATDLVVANTRRKWDAEFLPTITRDLEYMRRVDLEAASDSELVDYLDEFLEIQRHHWYIHFMVVFPMSVAVERMAGLYREIMGPVPDEEPYLLLLVVQRFCIDG